MAGDSDSIFSNLPGSPRRPKPPPDNRSLMQTMFPVDPRAVVGGLYQQGTEGAGDLAAGAARRIGLPNPDLLGHDVTAFMQSPTFGGGASPLAGAGTLAAGAPIVSRLASGGRTAEEIATGTRAASGEGDAAAQAARAAQASPGQAALDQMVQSSQAAAPSITAYHGSPHSFDRFDISKLGTGEGANVYGRGLYFAGNEDVAKSYRDSLAGGKWTYAGKPASETWDASALDYLDKKVADAKGMPAAIDDAIGRLKDQSSFYNQAYAGGDTAPNLYDNAIARLQRLDPSQVKPAGSMYQVSIKSDPNRFLDWDKTYGEHDPVTQDLISRAMLENDVSGPMGKPADEWLQEEQPTGEDIYNRLSSSTVKGAEPRLQGAGIPGIKYLDQGSRGAGGEGATHNYVTFSDDIVNILKKYGLAGLGLTAGAGALSASGQSPVSSPASAAPPQGMTLGAQPDWSP